MYIFLILCGCSNWRYSYRLLVNCLKIGTLLQTTIWFIQIEKTIVKKITEYRMRTFLRVLPIYKMSAQGGFTTESTFAWFWLKLRRFLEHISRVFNNFQWNLHGSKISKISSSSCCRHQKFAYKFSSMPGNESKKSWFWQFYVEFWHFSSCPFWHKYFTDQLFSAFHKLFCQIANLWDIDLRFSGIISDVNSDNPVQFRTCVEVAHQNSFFFRDFG